MRAIRERVTKWRFPSLAASSAFAMSGEWASAAPRSRLGSHSFYGTLSFLLMAFISFSVAQAKPIFTAKTHRFGGQGLILVVSDAVLGSISEITQQLPIAARPWLYKYDKVDVVYGSDVIQNDQLRRSALQMAQEMNVVDVFIFSHGGGGFVAFKNSGGKRHVYYSATDLGGMLAPLEGKFRLFYTAACHFGFATHDIIRGAGARVAISHEGLHTTPLTFPLKLLKYFKADGMAAVAAASKAWAYARENPNPLMRLAQPVISGISGADGLGGSQPLLVGDPVISGGDLDMRVPNSIFATRGQPVR